MNLTQLKVYIRGFADGLREGQAPKPEQWQELLKVVEEAQDDCTGNCPCKNPGIAPVPMPNTAFPSSPEPYWTTQDGTAPCDVEPYYNEIDNKFGRS